MEWLLDTSPFVPRWHCGYWEPWQGHTTIWADWAIFTAYTAIPFILFFFARRWGLLKHPPMQWITFLCMGFVLLCGISHALDALVFYIPVYRLFTVERVLAAAFSIGTMIALPFLCQNLKVEWRGKDG